MHYIDLTEDAKIAKLDTLAVFKLSEFSKDDVSATWLGNILTMHIELCTGVFMGFPN